MDYRTAPLFPADALVCGAVEAAQRLLGAILVSTIGERVTAGRIVETEAYFGPTDPASHAAERIGQTARNTPMYGPSGTAYVYRIYGVHNCLNVVTDMEGTPSAVLVRALEPLLGADAMAERRGRCRDLCSGPGRLAQALGITLDLNSHSFDAEPLTLHVGESVPNTQVRTTGRVGVTRAADWPLRFCVMGSPDVSPGRTQDGVMTSDYHAALAQHREMFRSAV